MATRESAITASITDVMQRGRHLTLDSIAKQIFEQLLTDGWLRTVREGRREPIASEMPDTALAATITFSGELFEKMVQSEVKRSLKRVIEGD